MILRMDIYAGNIETYGNECASNPYEVGKIMRSLYANWLKFRFVLFVYYGRLGFAFVCFEMKWLTQKTF